MILIRRVAVAAAFLSLAVVSANAQTVSFTTGAINGTVIDSTKAVLPGVAVTLSGPSVMGTPSTVTDASGTFRFPSLAPGDYQSVDREVGRQRLPRHRVCSRFPTDVWKVEYNSVLSNALLLEFRVGAYKSLWARVGKSSAVRVEDVGNNAVSGGVYAIDFDRARPQVNGALSYTKTGGLNLVDLRSEKILRFGSTRITGFLDVYNIFN